MFPAELRVFALLVVAGVKTLLLLDLSTPEALDQLVLLRPFRSTVQELFSVGMEGRFETLGLKLMNLKLFFHRR